MKTMPFALLLIGLSIVGCSSKKRISPEEIVFGGEYSKGRFEESSSEVVSSKVVGLRIGQEETVEREIVGDQGSLLLKVDNTQVVSIKRSRFVILKQSSYQEDAKSFAVATRAKCEIKAKDSLSETHVDCHEDVLMEKTGQNLIRQTESKIPFCEIRGEPAETLGIKKGHYTTVRGTILTDVIRTQARRAGEVVCTDSEGKEESFGLGVLLSEEIVAPGHADLQEPDRRGEKRVLMVEQFLTPQNRPIQVRRYEIL